MPSNSFPDEKLDNVSDLINERRKDRRQLTKGLCLDCMDRHNNKTWKLDESSNVETAQRTPERPHLDRRKLCLICWLWKARWGDQYIASALLHLVDRPSLDQVLDSAILLHTARQNCQFVAEDVLHDRGKLSGFGHPLHGTALSRLSPVSC